VLDIKQRIVQDAFGKRTPVRKAHGHIGEFYVRAGERAVIVDRVRPVENLLVGSVRCSTDQTFTIGVACLPWARRTWGGPCEHVPAEGTCSLRPCPVPERATLVVNGSSGCTEGAPRYP
jgi:hypothetical protein